MDKARCTDGGRHQKEGRKLSYIRVREPMDMRDPTNGPKAHQWMLTKLDAFRAAFRPRVLALGLQARSHWVYWALMAPSGAPPSTSGALQEGR